MQQRNRPTTPEVRAMRALPAEGDMIRPGWTRNIRSRHDQAIGGTSRQVSRARPFAIMLLARVCFMYSASPVHDSNGKVIGWARKFDNPFWYPNWAELAEEFGCSTRTLRDECALLVELGLIYTVPMRERTKADGAKNVPEFVIPKIKNILRITDRPAVSDVSFDEEKADEVSSDPADEETSGEPMKKLPKADEVSSVAADEETSSFPHILEESALPPSLPEGSDSEIESESESTNAREIFSAWLSGKDGKAAAEEFKLEGMAGDDVLRRVLWRCFERGLDHAAVQTRMVVLRSAFDSDPGLTYWPGWWIKQMLRDGGDECLAQYRQRNGISAKAVTMV